MVFFIHTELRCTVSHTSDSVISSLIVSTFRCASVTLLVTTEHLVVIWATKCRRLYIECSNNGGACRQQIMAIRVALCRLNSVTLRNFRRWLLLPSRKGWLAVTSLHPHCERDANSEWSVAQRHFFTTTTEHTSTVKPTKCTIASSLF